jgi:uncharacterized protein YggU (UPF0235/DUF167 family)
LTDAQAMGEFGRGVGDHRALDAQGRAAIEGIEQLADGQSVLKARVRAAASDGEANEALQRLMARTLDIAPRDIVLVAGRTSRIKRLLVRGDARAVAAKLEEIAEVLAK